MNAAPRTLAISFAIKGQIHETKPKGFGSSPSPGSNSRNTVTEDIIQSKITAAPGLREAMTLEVEKYTIPILPFNSHNVVLFYQFV